MFSNDTGSLEADTTESKASAKHREHSRFDWLVKKKAFFLLLDQSILVDNVGEMQKQARCSEAPMRYRMDYPYFPKVDLSVPSWG